MALRRMVSQQIVDSDAFLDMSTSAQALYFHLCVRADDDGFVGNPKKILRMTGGNDDDLRVLLAKRFVLGFESGVVVIKHWLIHNLIRSDLYKETQYKKEKSQLGLNENGAYTELTEGVAEIKVIEPPLWLKHRKKELRTANVPQTARRLGKDRLGKDNKTPSENKSRKDKFETDKYPKENYTKVIQEYQQIKAIKLQGDEFLPVMREVKLMFKSGRTPEQIIETMRVCESNYDDWSMNTVRMKLPDVVSGKLGNKDKINTGLVAKGARDI